MRRLKHTRTLKQPKRRVLKQLTYPTEEERLEWKAELKREADMRDGLIEKPPRPLPRVDDEFIEQAVDGDISLARKRTIWKRYLRSQGYDYDKLRQEWENEKAKVEPKKGAVNMTEEEYRRKIAEFKKKHPDHPFYNPNKRTRPQRERPWRDRDA